jgi:hypothetical protein
MQAPLDFSPMYIYTLVTDFYATGRAADTRKRVLVSKKS